MGLIDRRHYENLVRLALLVCGLAVTLLLVDPFVAELPATLFMFWRRPRYLRLLVTVCIEGGCLLTIALGLLHRRRAVRWTVVIVVVATGAAHAAYSAVTRHPVQLFDLQLMTQEAVHAGGAIRMYEWVWGPKLVLASVALLAVCVLAARLVPFRASRSFAMLLPVTFALLYWSVRSRDNLAVVYPSPLSIPAMALRNLMFHLQIGPRSAVPIAPVRHGPRFIVYLIDESTRGDMLGINGGPAGTTPYLQSLDLVNFGVASSVANCSATSNLIMRNGLTVLPDTQDRAFKVPSLFQYARKAGYRTVFIEGQRLGGVLQNYLTRYDMAHVDDFHWMARPISCERSGDCFVADEIVATFERGSPAVIYAVKNGSHPPYQDQYPASRRFFTPTLAPGEVMEDRARTLNSYYNALRWNVDDFFADLLPRIQGYDYLILYTADHGQNILENGYYVTHCSERTAAPTEAMVPLFALTSNAGLRAELSRNLSYKAGRATGFDIFPTVLWAMGYDEGTVRALYGPSLRDREVRPRRFFSGNAFSSGSNLWRDFP